MSAALAVAPDAAMALGIASTAMPFARTPEEEMERWLRVLRLHGEVGAALQGLGVSEEPVATEGTHGAHAHSREDVNDPVALVTEQAMHIAEQRGASALASTDLLLALMHVYGEDFDRALHLHGAERGELLERLGLSEPDSDVV